MAAAANQGWVRFRLRSLLVAMTLAALWLSTLAGYTGSNDVQAFIWMAILVTSGIAAASSKRKRRAFWAGFCSAMLLMSNRSVVNTFGARLTWTTTLAKEWGQALQRGPSQGQRVLNINTTLILLTLLAAATAIGFLSAVVYEQCTKDADAGNGREPQGRT